MASRIGAELLNVSADTSGAMASDARRLVRVSEKGEKWSRGTWTASEIRRQLLSAIAVAVQRGNALAMLTGYTRATVKGYSRATASSGAGQRGLAAQQGAEGVVGLGC